MINVGTLLATLDFQDRMTPVVQQALATLKSLDSATTMTSAQVRTLGTHMGMTSEDMKKLDISTRMTDAQLRELTGTMKMTDYQVTLLGRGLSEAGVIMTGVTAALGLITKAVIETGSEFETQMTRVVTLAGASREQIDEITPAVLKLAEASGVGPAELAKGLYVLMSTGMQSAEAMESLRVASEMTALGMGDMHDTTLAVTGAVFAYKEQNLQAAEAASILIKAVQLGNMEIQDLTPAIARVNPIAAALGVGFRDVAAGIATFTHAGVDSAVAATGMRAMLNNILTDSVKTEKGFALLARTLNDNTISMANFRQEMKDKGFTQAMVDLAEKVGKAGDAGVKAFGSIFPNVRALTEALFVYKVNGEMVTNMMADMNDGVDELSKGTAELHKTWAWQWEQMKISAEKLWIELSTSLLPIFKNFLAILHAGMPILSGIISIFNALPAPIQIIVIALAGLVAILGPLMLLFGQLIMAYGNIKRAFDTMNLAIHTAVINANTQAWLGNAMAMRLAQIQAIPLIGSVVSLTKAFYGFLISSWGIAIVGITAIAVAIHQFTKEAEINTQAVYSSIDAHSNELKTLQKLQAELDPTIAKKRSMRDISNELLKLAPEYMGALNGEALSYNSLVKSMDGATKSKLEMLKTDQIVLSNQIALMKEKKAQIEKDIKVTGGILSVATDPYNEKPGPHISSGHTQKLTEEYDKQKTALAELNIQLTEAEKRNQAVNEVLHPKYHLFMESERAAAAAAKATNLAASGAVGQAIAMRGLLDQVDAFTQTQRDAIEAAYKGGLKQSKQIYEEIVRIDDLNKTTFAEGLSPELINIYINKMKEAAGSTKGHAKELKDLAQESASAGRFIEVMGDKMVFFTDGSVETTTAMAKLALTTNLSIEDISRVLNIPPEQLRIWKKEITEVEAAQEKFAKDTLKSQNQIAVSLANTAALQIKADGNLYSAKIANVNTWLTRSVNALNQLNISEEDYWDHREVLENEAKARINAINAERVRNHQAMLGRMAEEEQRYIAQTAVLWEQYATIILDTTLTAGLGQANAIQAQYLKAEEENRKHSNKMLDDVLTALDEEVIGTAAAQEQIDRINRRAAEQSIAILAIKEAKLFDARADMIVAGLTRISEKLGATARVAVDAWKVIGNNTQIWVSNPEEPESGHYEAAVSTTAKFVAGLGAASALVNVLFENFNNRSATAAKSALALAATGAAIGAAFTPLGSVIGAAVGALVGLVSGWNQSGETARQANRDADHAIDVLQTKLITTYGSLANIDTIGKAIGVDLKGAWGDTTVAGLEHFKNMVDEFEAKMKSLQTALEKYGMTWKDLGQDMKNLFQGQFADDLLEEFNVLIGSGVDYDKVIRGMGEAFSAFIVDAISAGTKIPAAMEPIIKRMIELGVITDAAANALYRYQAPGTLDALNAKVKELEDAMAELFLTSSEGWEETGNYAKYAETRLIALTLAGYGAAAGGTEKWLEYQEAVRQYGEATQGAGSQLSKLVDESLRAQAALAALQEQGYDTAEEGTAEWLMYQKALQDWEKAAQAAGAAMVGVGNSTAIAMIKAKTDVNAAAQAIRDLEDAGYDMAKEGTDEWKKYQKAIEDWKKAVKESERLTANLTDAQKKQLDDIIAKYGDLNGEIAEYMRLVGLANDNMPKFEDIMEAAKRYGLTLDQLGPKVRQLDINQQASQIVKDLKIFEQAGVDIGMVLSTIPPAYAAAAAEVQRLKDLHYDTAAEGSEAWKEYQKALETLAGTTAGMGQQVQNLVTEAMKYGLELPSSMKPIIETMIEAGLLVDENGDKLTDLSELTFAADLEEMFETLITKLGELIDAIKGPDGVAGALGQVARTEIPPFRVKYYYEAMNEVDIPYDGGPQAKGGDYYVTRPTVFLAGEAGPERVSFSGALNPPLSNSSSGGASGRPIEITVVSQISKREFARAVVKLSPNELELAGL